MSFDPGGAAALVACEDALDAENLLVWQLLLELAEPEVNVGELLDAAVAALDAPSAAGPAELLQVLRELRAGRRPARCREP